jgi:mannose-1-phosphate guanylyltransferase/mannose-6-phosphate isomerase
MNQNQDGIRRIVPVILCGGSGTRLWPVSRKKKPKPFLPLLGDTTLFQQTLARAGDPALFAPPVIVAGQAHVDLIEEQLGRFAEGARIVVEPAAKNTAPAIALAAGLLHDDDVMLVCPSDHYIANEAAFVAAAQKAATLARGGRLVTFGIAPDRPETGYGYIRQGVPLDEADGTFQVDRFVEKPDLERAQAFLSEGGYFWNGGIFAFTAGAYRSELAAHRPEMARAVDSALRGVRANAGQLHPDGTAFAAIEGDSIDYAVMENTQMAALVPVSMGWSDIGNWQALRDALPPDDAGNRNAGSADLEDCRNVLTMSDGPHISAIGVEDLVIVVSGNEVLVTTASGAQRVGKLPGVERTNAD